MSSIINEFINKNKVVAAICGATLELAKSGVLNRRKHSSSSLDYLTKNVANYSGQTLYQDQIRAVSDQNVISANGFSPYHFAAEVFRSCGLPDSDVTDFLKSLGEEFK